MVNLHLAQHYWLDSEAGMGLQVWLEKKGLQATS